MGIIKRVVWGLPPIMAGCLYLAYRLGPKLPGICKRTGNYMGLGYRCFKIVIAAMKPGTESGEMVHLWNKSNIHIKTFARESRLNYTDLRTSLRKSMPKELVEDPFERFRMAQDAPRALPQIPSGTHFISVVREEQQRCALKRQAAEREKEFRAKF